MDSATQASSFQQPAKSQSLNLVGLTLSDTVCMWGVYRGCGLCSAAAAWRPRCCSLSMSGVARVELKAVELQLQARNMWQVCDLAPGLDAATWQDPGPQALCHLHMALPYHAVESAVTDY
jgi:hypothetical protein